MDEDALISVIIPAYNAEATIATTLASVLEQSDRHLDIWVIDDGSTDATAAVVEAVRRQATRPLHLLQQANGGQARARNLGLARSRGELVAFLDADDYWSSNKLAAQRAALVAHPQAALAYSWTHYVDEAGRSLHRGSEVACTGWVAEALIVANFLENGSNALVRRSAIAAVGDFNPALVPSEDWDLWLRLAERFQFVAVPQVQVFYRVSAASQSSDTRRLERSCLACIAAWQQRASVRRRAYAPDQARPTTALARRAKANVYKYLTHKHLDGAAQVPKPRQRFSRGCWLWMRACYYDPGLLGRRVALRVGLRLGAIALLPSRLAHRWLTAPGGKRWLAIDPLLGYIDRPQ